MTDDDKRRAANEKFWAIWEEQSLNGGPFNEGLRAWWRRQYERKEDEGGEA